MYYLLRSLYPLGYHVTWLEYFIRVYISSTTATQVISQHFLYRIRMLLWILLLVTLSLWWFYTKYQAGYWARRGIPHDNPYPIVGSLWPILSFRRSPGLLLKDLYYHPNARKAPVFGFHIFGKPAILLRDPEVIKRVIIKVSIFFFILLLCTKYAYRFLIH